MYRGGNVRLRSTEVNDGGDAAWAKNPGDLIHRFGNRCQIAKDERREDSIDGAVCEGDGLAEADEGLVCIVELQHRWLGIKGDNPPVTKEFVGRAGACAKIEHGPGR